jgi:succinate dehydrogenase / fumarate reductase cytochrome b subunit
VGSWFGRLLLLGWTFSLFFHLANGIRHLCWDAGYGFEIKTATISGWVVVAASAALTVIVWVVGLAAMAG